MAEIVVLVTTPEEKVAVSIAQRLVEQRLIACANILPTIRSIFLWQGKVEDEGEVLMILKSQDSRLGEICNKIKELHPYDVPEIIALPIVGGSHDYLVWVRNMTGRTKKSENSQ